jgi:putative SOS response-associated peptidase YedK
MLARGDVQERRKEEAMCGKFKPKRPWRDMHALYRLTAPAEIDIETDEIVTPMRFAPVLRMQDGRPALTPMRWGFAGKGDVNPGKPKHMHARAETIDALATFADAFVHRRCVLVVETFNEGEEVGAKTVQWTITPRDGQPIAIAAIYEEWRNGAESLFTFVMVTTPPNDLIARITDRMPAILAPEDVARWLSGTPDEAKALLRTYDDAGAWEMARQDKRRGKAQGDLFG